MSAVSRSRAMISWVSTATCAAPLSGRALRWCSSRSRSFGRHHVAMRSVSAWRCPPESVPIGLSSLSSRPMLSVRTRSRSPRRDAAAESDAEARRMTAALGEHEVLCNGHLGCGAGEWILEHPPDQGGAAVLGPRSDILPASSIVPPSGRKVPATALRSVLLPEPLVPMMPAKAAVFYVEVDAAQRSHSVGSAREEGLSAANDPKHGGLKEFAAQHAGPAGQHQRREDEPGGHELEVVGIEAPAQRDRHQQAEEDRAHDRPADGQSGAGAADKRLGR